MNTHKKSGRRHTEDYPGEKNRQGRTGHMEDGNQKSHLVSLIVSMFYKKHIHV